MFAFARTIKTSATSATRQFATKGAKLAGVALLSLAVAACAATNRKHGWVPSSEELAEVVVGIDTRDSVAETLGEPSTTGVIRSNGYYYISSVVRHYGARAPEVISRDLVAITFDAKDVVKGVEHYTLADGRVIPLERRVTSSSIDDKTFLRQLLGNLGNFDPGSFLSQ